MAGRRDIDRKFAGDVIWNIASLAVLGISGIAINILIAREMDAAALGLFNQVYAIFIILSQVAVGGIHHAALKFTVEASDNRGEAAAVATASLLLAAVLGALVSFLVWLLAPFFGRAFDSSGVAQGLAWAAPGLFFFAINKVALGLLNGLRQMRIYAALQALRFLLMLLVVGAVVVLQAEASLLCASFLVSECCITLIAFAYLLASGRIAAGRPASQWRRIGGFGLRGFFGGLLLEANFRVDVVMLGVFVSDGEVGLYSIAAALAEGFYSLLHVLRVNVNPLLVQHVRTGERESFVLLIASIQRLALPLSLLALLLTWLLAPLVAGWLLPGRGFEPAIPILLVLLAGLTAYSPWLPFDFILLQSGRPGLHTAFLFAQLSSNVLLNLVMIPAWGALGAAIATAIAFVAAAVYLNLATRHSLGLLLLAPWRGYFNRG